MQVLLLYPMPHWVNILADTDDFYGVVSMDGINTLVRKDGTQQIRVVQ
jgi:hypothetical protein